MRRGHVYSGANLVALQQRAKGCATRHKGQCALCHGIESGNSRQSFPVGKGEIDIAGYRICPTHAKILQGIAASSGITWTPGGNKS